MTAIDAAALETQLKKRLSADVFSHSRRTSATAVSLAKIHGVDEYRARVAGLAHDVAKDLTGEELLERAGRYGMHIDPVEYKKPYLLHAAIGAKMIVDDLGIEDEMIIDAVAKHTCGDTNMSKLDKIIYLADVMEPGRDFNGLQEIRKLAEVSLEDAFAAAYKGQLIFIIEKGGYLHPRTVDVWNRIASEVNGESGRV